MVTELLSPTAENIEKCAKLLRAGEIVAFPTETVYGLGANALDGSAAKKIFEAKGRPAANPLIVHVSNAGQIDLIAHINEKAQLLIDQFMPGPLTLVLNKKPDVADIVTAGGGTVGVRMPDHPVALALIEKAGVPVCAPSANTSSRPSPTMAEHVYEDLNGKIPAIIDGGKCPLGVESTIIDLTGQPRVLRAGAVPLSEIEKVIGAVNTDVIYSNELNSMKTPKNFVPRINMMFSAYFTGMADNINAYYDQLVMRSEKPVIFCLDWRKEKYGGRSVILMGETVDDYARNLFEKIREAEKEYSVVIAEGVPKTGLGVTLLSRLVKLSHGQVI